MSCGGDGDDGRLAKQLRKAMSMVVALPNYSPSATTPLPPRDAALSYETLSFLCAFVDRSEMPEGLFRVPGATRAVDSAMSLLKSLVPLSSPEDHPELESLTPHDAASVLKRLLRELQEPLVPREQFERLVGEFQEVGDGRSSSPEGLAGAVVREARELPPLNRACLHRLCRTLGRVVGSVVLTKMNSTNLAIVLAPSLFQTTEDGFLVLSVAANIIALLIDRTEEVFGPSVLPVEWLEIRDARGGVRYWNSETRKTVTERPNPPPDLVMRVRPTVLKGSAAEEPRERLNLTIGARRRTSSMSMEDDEVIVGEPVRRNSSTGTLASVLRRTEVPAGGHRKAVSPPPAPPPRALVSPAARAVVQPPASSSRAPYRPPPPTPPDTREGPGLRKPEPQGAGSAGAGGAPRNCKTLSKSVSTPQLSAAATAAATLNRPQFVNPSRLAPPPPPAPRPSSTNPQVSPRLKPSAVARPPSSPSSPAAGPAASPQLPPRPEPRKVASFSQPSLSPPLLPSQTPPKIPQFKTPPLPKAAKVVAVESQKTSTGFPRDNRTPPPGQPSHTPPPRERTPPCQQHQKSVSAPVHQPPSRGPKASAFFAATRASETPPPMPPRHVSPTSPRPTSIGAKPDPWRRPLD